MPSASPSAPPWQDEDAQEACLSASQQDGKKLDELAAQIGLTRPAEPGEALDLGFICPLTLEVFEDCVQASDGHT